MLLIRNNVYNQIMSVCLLRVESSHRYKLSASGEGYACFAMSNNCPSIWQERNGIKLTFSSVNLDNFHNFFITFDYSSNFLKFQVHSRPTFKF